MTREEFEKQLQEGLDQTQDKTIVNAVREGSADEYDLMNAIQATLYIEKHDVKKAIESVIFAYGITILEKEVREDSELNKAIEDGNVKLVHTIMSNYVKRQDDFFKNANGRRNK